MHFYLQYFCNNIPIEFVKQVKRAFDSIFFFFQKYGGLRKNVYLYSLKKICIVNLTFIDLNSVLNVYLMIEE